MAGEDNAIIFGYEIQHEFPSEIWSSPGAADARALLDSVGFDKEAIGNKVALLRNAETRDALQSGPPEVLEAFEKAGGGLNLQNSYRNPNPHPGYNAFIIDQLGQLYRRANLEGWDQVARERAVFDFFGYIDEINKTGSID